MASLILKDLTKVYTPKAKGFSLFKSKKKDDGIVVVNAVNLEVRDKEFVVLTGSVGCGKSTVLQMIAGQEEISGGELIINGMWANNMPPHERGVALVPQEHEINPDKTAYESMAAALKAYKMPKEEVSGIIQSIANFLDISHLLERKPKALSTYQRRLLAIGIALVTHPRILLMDESGSRLDAEQRRQLKALVIRLHRNLNMTFLYATDDPAEAMALADRIVVMREGLVQQIGTPQALFNAPTSRYIAEYMSTPKMNFFPAELVNTNGTYTVALDGLTVQLPQQKQASLAAQYVQSQQVLLGVRPEHMLKEHGLYGIVDMVEMMGPVVHLHMNAMGHDAVMAASASDAAGMEYAAMKRGDVVEFNIPGHACYFFDPYTERNLEV